MGAFSDAFNHMVRTLQERENGLKDEIIKRQEATDALSHANEFLVSVLSSITDIVIVVQGDEILFCNKTGYEELPDLSSDTRDFLLTSLLNYRSETEQDDVIEIFDNRRNKHYSIKSIPMDWMGNDHSFLQIATDITETKTREATLTEIAYLDELTGIPNRRSGFYRLNALLKSESNYPICICYIDVDKLKYVNDVFGHHHGDTYIKTIAEVISSSIRGTDFAARMGGDEFIAILTRQDSKGAKVVISRIEDKLKKLSNTPERPYDMIFSYGLEEVLEKGKKTANEYIMEADRRMYELKRSRKINEALEMMKKDNSASTTSDSSKTILPGE